MRFVFLSIVALALAACSTVDDLSKYQVLDEPHASDCMVQPANSKLWYPCGSDEAKAADCLNLMETAMKAVDSYLDNMSIPEETREKTLKVWDRAKQNCWLELKDLQPQHYH